MIGPDGEGEEAVEGDIGSAVRLTSFLKRASQVGHVTCHVILPGGHVIIR